MLALADIEISVENTEVKGGALCATKVDRPGSIEVELGHTQVCTCS